MLRRGVRFVCGGGCSRGEAFFAKGKIESKKERGEDPRSFLALQRKKYIVYSDEIR